MRDFDPAGTTKRLRVRAHSEKDVEALTTLASDREIADTMISIPYPISGAAGVDWISKRVDKSDDPSCLALGLELLASGELVGCCDLRDIDPVHRQAELSFWIGKRWWGHGYASEGAAEVIRIGFHSLSLNRIYAHHMQRNPSSGRVLTKLNLRQEGVLRQRVRKWGVFEDVVLYATVRSDWEKGWTAHNYSAERELGPDGPLRGPQVK